MNENHNANCIFCNIISGKNKDAVILHQVNHSYNLNNNILLGINKEN